MIAGLVGIVLIAVAVALAIVIVCKSKAAATATVNTAVDPNSMNIMIEGADQIIFLKWIIISSQPCDYLFKIYLYH